MAAKKKKLTKKQISAELQRSAEDYAELCNALHTRMLQNVASRLMVEPEEIEEEWGALT